MGDVMPVPSPTRARRELNPGCRCHGGPESATVGRGADSARWTEQEPDEGARVAGQAADAYAVVVFQLDGLWSTGMLPEALGDDLDGLVAAVRQQPGEGGAFALVDVSDEYFVVVRVQPGRVRLLLSDVTASASWDLAAQVVDALDLDLPGEDDLDDVWPVGDLGIFADLGVDEMELGAILSDVDAYADEMLSALARRLGFGGAYERVVDALVG